MKEVGSLEESHSLVDVLPLHLALTLHVDGVSAVVVDAEDLVADLFALLELLNFKEAFAESFESGQLGKNRSTLTVLMSFRPSLWSLTWLLVNLSFREVRAFLSSSLASSYFSSLKSSSPLILCAVSIFIKYHRFTDIILYTAPDASPRKSQPTSSPFRPAWRDVGCLSSGSSRVC